MEETLIKKMEASERHDKTTNRTKEQMHGIVYKKKSSSSSCPVEMVCKFCMVCNGARTKVKKSEEPWILTKPVESGVTWSPEYSVKESSGWGSLSGGQRWGD